MMHLQKLVNDGLSFAQSFGMDMAKSAPHIYLSALPFASTSSYILSIKCGKASHWPALEIMIQVEGCV